MFTLQLVTIAMKIAIRIVIYTRKLNEHFAYPELTIQSQQGIQEDDKQRSPEIGIFS